MLLHLIVINTTKSVYIFNARSPDMETFWFTLPPLLSCQEYLFLVVEIKFAFILVVQTKYFSTRVPAIVLFVVRPYKRIINVPDVQLLYPTRAKCVPVFINPIAFGLLRSVAHIHYSKQQNVNRVLNITVMQEDRLILTFRFFLKIKRLINLKHFFNTYKIYSMPTETATT